MATRYLRWLALITCSLALAAFAPVRATAAEKDSTAPKADAKDKAGKDKPARSARVPFHGKLGAVDKAKMTITIEGKEKPRVIHVTATTRITKAGKTATLGDGVVGEEVAGQLVKAEDGRENALSLRFGPKPESDPAEPRKKKPAEEK